jgi:hypothetical protein
MEPIYSVYITPTNYECIKADYGNGKLLYIPIDPANADYQDYLRSLEPQD